MRRQDLPDPFSETQANKATWRLLFSFILFTLLTVVHRFINSDGPGTKVTVRSPISQDIRCSKQLVPKTIAVPHPVE